MVVVRQKVLERHLEEGDAADPHAGQLLVGVGPVLHAVAVAARAHALAVNLKNTTQNLILGDIYIFPG